MRDNRLPPPRISLIDFLNEVNDYPCIVVQDMVKSSRQWVRLTKWVDGRGTHYREFELFIEDGNLVIEDVRDEFG